MDGVGSKRRVLRVVSVSAASAYHPHRGPADPLKANIMAHDHLWLAVYGGNSQHPVQQISPDDSLYRRQIAVLQSLPFTSFGTGQDHNVLHGTSGLKYWTYRPLYLTSGADIGSRGRHRKWTFDLKPNALARHQRSRMGRMYPTVLTKCSLHCSLMP
jgi:hypothetical protein